MEKMSRLQRFQAFYLFLLSSFRLVEERCDVLVGVKFTLEDYYPCTDEKYAIEYSDIVVGHFNRSTIVLNATLIYNEDMSDKFHIKAELTKCDSKQQKDSCQYFYTLEIDEMCKNWDNPNALEHEFEQSIVNMKKECPVPAGTYNVVNAIFDLKEIEHTPAFGGYWYIKFMPHDGDRQVGCFIAEASLSRKRN